MSLNEMIMWCLFIEQIIVCYSKHSYVSEKGPACFTSWLKWMDSVCDLALAGSVTQSHVTSLAVLVPVGDSFWLGSTTLVGT